MKDNSVGWGGRYLRVARRFIPAPLRQDAAVMARAENVVNAAIMAGTAGPQYALACWLLRLHSAALEILACPACMLLAPAVLRTAGCIQAARELFLCALSFNFSWLTWHLGGIGAPTASWLLALYPAADCDLDALLKRADLAMRCAKEWGENSVQAYRGVQVQPPGERLALKNGLREALAGGQLYLEYQPQLDLASQPVIGAEALLRWQHPVCRRLGNGVGRSFAVAETIVAMAHRLGRSVIAESFETREQLRDLRNGLRRRPGLPVRAPARAGEDRRAVRLDHAA